jgi:hypothetical protein
VEVLILCGEVAAIEVLRNAPRGPAVPVDLERLRARLAEAAARRELDDGAGASLEGMWARRDRGAARRLARSITQAYHWLARFAPLLEEIEGAGAEDCRRCLQQVPALRADGQPLLAELERLAPPAEGTLVATLRDALRELDGLEKDYRQRLGLLAPGDPAGEVDLAPLRARLAEAAARREVAALGTAEGCTPRYRLSVPQGTRCSQEQLELEGRELTLHRRTWLGPAFGSIRWIRTVARASHRVPRRPREIPQTPWCWKTRRGR